MQDGGIELFSVKFNTIYFKFFHSINALVIDWSNFDLRLTTIDYADDAGNELIGIFSETPFRNLQFTLNSEERLQYDYVQYGSLVSDVPAPPRCDAAARWSRRIFLPAPPPPRRPAGPCPRPCLSARLDLQGGLCEGHRRGVVLASPTHRGRAFWARTPFACRGSRGRQPAGRSMIWRQAGTW